LALLACAAPLHAQTAPSPPRVEFLPRAEFHLSAELLTAIDDPRFVWDTNFGGELDVLDYGRGRMQFVANYQAMLGEELRAFDPNQGNYILEGSASGRLQAVEIAGVFYHQSRHLADRPKTFAIDWNMLGGRVRRALLVGALYLDARADIRRTIQRSFVDYTWEFDGRVRGDRVLHPRIGILFEGQFRHLGVDGSRGRGGQTGYRGEGGVRFEGGVAAVELFAAVERRIDAYQLEFGTASWLAFGFRLQSR
jgi:hypothetical protein